jgi:hypothetical protein
MHVIHVLHNNTVLLIVNQMPQNKYKCVFVLYTNNHDTRQQERFSVYSNEIKDA